MHDNMVGRTRRSGWAAGVAAFVLWLAAPAAQAATPLGLYLGGAFGQARVEATLPDASSGKTMQRTRSFWVCVRSQSQVRSSRMSTSVIPVASAAVMYRTSP